MIYSSMPTPFYSDLLHIVLTVTYCFINFHIGNKTLERGRWTMYLNEINVIHRFYLFNERRNNRILLGKSIYTRSGSALT